MPSKDNLKSEHTNQLLFDNQILRVEQVAEMLQFSKWHVYRLVSQNKIPFYKKGRTLFFMSKEIIEWIAKKEM
jgi:excisionase family DNA binding protein